MLLMLDNYDSFTYNLVQYFAELGAEVKVVRNDEMCVEEIRALNPSHLVISPGPCTPNEAGVSLAAIKAFAGQLPILGICLGHQSIAQVFGGRVVRASQVMHGKVSRIAHDGQGVFQDLPQNLQVTRYHSLVVEPASVPQDFVVSAWVGEDDVTPNAIMGIRHQHLPIEGVQFHPESILSEHGHAMLANFLKMTCLPA
ncbi:anthranilate synthase component 2 [Allopseudospirillum japonicum]|uniref:Anthranilate synthase component 2 n=1 Tax=Allopseudospirillum japonicum TaxID=64971 RepID=A0A1H6RT70_9GAMM|nr:aminodeoxychorismate/anthranilate synthase component II [Allopseudospirillum japonicum]SEI54382.1 anthranilate synthase component 2 [Allopseudospirillum japonicum]